MVRAATRRPDNIRVADELLVDPLFTANGESYESVRLHVRQIDAEGAALQVLDIEGLLETKTDYRERDVLDKRMLGKIKRDL